MISRDPDAECYCNIPFTLDSDFKGKVYMYYGLSNFYQNHRRYVKSRDDNQLLGWLSTNVSSDCFPFDYTDNTSKEKIAIAPCGAIANSMFNGESSYLLPELYLEYTFEMKMVYYYKTLVLPLTE